MKRLKFSDRQNIIDRAIVHNNITTIMKEPNYKLLQPFFNYLPVNIIKKIFLLSTQYS